MISFSPLSSPTLALRLWIFAVSASTLFPFIVSAAAVPTPEAVQPIGLWETRSGDQLIADTMNNMGYLVHVDGSFTEFPIVTGQRRNVHYVGRTYFAATPVQKWNVTSQEVQSDRSTFGRHGHFLRMNKSHYGIHPTKYGDELLSKMAPDRFRSLGCIIVSDSVFELIASIYQKNNNTLSVTTVYGFDAGYASGDTLLKLAQDSERGS